VGKKTPVREYEIGSEAWIRERIENGLDPGECDQSKDDRALHLQVELDPAWRRIEPYSGGSTSNHQSSVVF
jgi:hypothetical protein